MALRVEAEWRKLILINYSIDPSVLLPLVPAGTTLDFCQDHCYVSLVGFLFINSKLNGIPIPFHQSFEEVNLRFYVSRTEGDLKKRGVVFIRELVPKSAVTFIANQVFDEHYRTTAMRHAWKENESFLQTEYSWKKNKWHQMQMTSEKKALPLTPGSVEEFFTEHYWGYTQRDQHETLEYFVDHIPWEIYPTKSYALDVDFEMNYGSSFAFLQHQIPDSAFLAEGSPILLKKSQLIRK